MLHVTPRVELARPVSFAVQRQAIVDLHFNAVGVAAIVPLRCGQILRAFIAAGSAYVVHPVDVVEAGGKIVELPTTSGLRASRSTGFAWELNESRRLLTVPMADVALRKWVEEHLDTLPAA